jgi:type VI secretion system protein ImpE
MNAEESLRHGDLQAAMSALQDQVRSDPSNVEYRVFLFQLLCVTGDWERALTQLNVAGDLDAGTLAMVHTYRDLLQCEALRQRVFAGEISPMIFGEPEEWFAKVIEALRVDASGKLDKAQQLRLEAFEAAPVVAGTLNGTEFEWVADADSRIGPFLEAIINGRYYWVPFHQISEIRCDDPEDLRDFVWAPAQFFLPNGGQTVGFIPTRYTGSEAAEDDLIRLARKTEWDELADGVYAGLGQRMLVTDSDEYPLLEVRNLALANANGDG